MEYSSKSNYQRFVCSVPLFVRHILCSVGLSFTVMFITRSVRSSVGWLVRPFVELSSLSLSLSLSLSSFALRAPLHSGDFTGERPQRHLMNGKSVLLFSPDVIAAARACPFVHARCD
jgi:hypothetical protein